MLRILTFICLLFLLSCKSKEERMLKKDARITAKIKKEIAKAESDIENLIKPKSCAVDVAECRGRWVWEGDGCSPYFIYNVKDVDPVELDAKFAILKKWEEAYMEQNPIGPMCSRINPDSLFIKDCKCEGMAPQP